MLLTLCNLEAKRSLLSEFVDQVQTGNRVSSISLVGSYNGESENGLNDQYG